MSLVKTGDISNCCHPNALLTLKEYLEDYAGEDTKIKGAEAIKREIGKIVNDNLKSYVEARCIDIEKGERDFSI